MKGMELTGDCSAPVTAWWGHAFGRWKPPRTPGTPVFPVDGLAVRGAVTLHNALYARCMSAVGRPATACHSSGAAAAFWDDDCPTP